MFDIIKYKKGLELKKGNIYEGNDGVYRYIENKLYSAVVKIKPTFSGDELKNQILKFNLPKIPYSIFNQVYEFFKYVYKEHRSEVAILLWYNFEKDEWKIEVPKQTVSGASVNYTRDENFSKDLINKDYICVGTIHSHCEMGAFHSGTDDSDEYNFDGLHITIGKVISGPTFAQRYIVKNMSYKIDDIKKVVDFPEEELIKYPSEWNSKVEDRKYFSNTKEKIKGFKGYNKDGSLKTKYNPSDYTSETMSNKEKMKKSSKYFNYKDDLYHCPLCEDEFPPESVEKDYACPVCGFKLYDDVDEFILNYVEDAEEEDLKSTVKKNLGDYI